MPQIRTRLDVEFIWQIQSPIDAGLIQQIRSHAASRLSGSAFCTPENIDEVCQDALNRYYRYVNDNPGAVQNPRAYIIGITDNVCKTLMKRQSRERLHSVSMFVPVRSEKEDGLFPLDLIVDGADSPEEEIIRRERVELLYDAIKSLPSPLRQVMYLHARGVKYQDIAQAIGKTQATVRRYVRMGQNQLREMLSGED